MLWKHGLNVQILDSNPNVIDTLIDYEGKKFFASFVYGNTDRKLRLNLWDHLLRLADDSWFLTGDLNDILCSEEKDGGVIRPEGSFSDLRTFFSEGDLFDLQHTGDPLFWRGKRRDFLVRYRLDRAAANTRWAECFPSARCQYLDYEGSDHKPLISLFDRGDKRKRGMFHYDRRLCKNEEAKKIVADAWLGDPLASVTEKLANARSVISAWNRTQQRNSMKIIEEKRKELNAALSSRVEDSGLIHEITPQLNSAYAPEEEYWK